MVRMWGAREDPQLFGIVFRVARACVERIWIRRLKLIGHGRVSCTGATWITLSLDLLRPKGSPIHSVRLSSLVGDSMFVELVERRVGTRIRTVQQRWMWWLRDVWMLILASLSHEDMSSCLL